MKKTYLLLAFLLVASVQAATLRIELNTETWQPERYFVFEDLSQYLFSTGGAQFMDTVFVQSVYENGTTRDHYVTQFGVSHVENPTALTGFIVQANDSEATYTVSLCNNNNVCEPCTSSDCTVSENALVCGDCQEDTADNVCDPDPDGVCDPDCPQDDPDCAMDPEQVCLDEGGQVCETCSDTYYQMDDDRLCCFGSCEVIEEYVADLDLDRPVQKQNYSWLFVLVGVVISIILAVVYMKRGHLHMFIMLLAVGGSLLFFFNIEPSITGRVTQEEAISSYPEFFEYSAEKNENLYIALTAISAEFNEIGIPVTEEILAAITATLRMEVGGTFQPVSEYSFSHCPRYSGGCDYRGRGYIQLTHNYNYENYCGSDCLLQAGQTCPCAHGGQGCTENEVVADGDLYDYIAQCPPARALLPEYASKAFALYYEGRNLHVMSNNRQYYDVGVGINGGSGYGRDFSRIANEYMDLFDTYPDKTDALLSHLNSGDYEPPDPDPPQPPPDEGETPEIPQEIRSGEKLGYYYLNPSVTAQTDIGVYAYLSGQAQHLLDSCGTTALSGCVLEEVEQFDDDYTWSFSCGSRHCTFDVDTKETIVVEDGTYEEHPLIVRFALDFS